MVRLRLALLGPYEAVLDGRPVHDLGYGKLRALLAFLAVEADRAHSREVLADLFWPDQEPELARQSLRQALARLRAALGDRDGSGRPFLLVTRNEVRLDPEAGWSADVLEITPLLAACQPHDSFTLPCCRRRHVEISALFRGHFLENLSVPDCPHFEGWLSQRRGHYDRIAAQVLGRLGECLAQSGDYHLALHYSRRHLDFDPWCEEAHRQVMRLMALDGDRTGALAHFRRCADLLAEDLGVSVEPETAALAASIRGGTLRAETRHRAAMEDEIQPVAVLHCELAGAFAASPPQLRQAALALNEAGAALLRGYDCDYVAPVAGDALVAFFGGPPEEAARQAVRAGLAMAAMSCAALRLRVGVHAGSGLRAAGSGWFSGPAPRVARRLADAAPAGGMLLSDAVLALLDDAFVWSRAAAVEVADLAAPLPAFRLAGASDRA